MPRHLRLPCVIALGAFSFSAFAAAESAPSGPNAMELVRRSDCLTCHAVDKRIIGPSFKEVAAKYKSNPATIDLLSKKIKAGGSGNWGSVAMLPHPNMSEADLKVIVEWILTPAVKSV